MNLSFCFSTDRFVLSQKKRMAFLIFLCFFAIHGFAQTIETDPLQAQPLVKVGRIESGQNFSLEIQAKLPPGFHAYSDQIRIEIKNPEGFQASQIRVDNEVEFFDKFSKKNRKGFSGETLLHAQIEAPLKIEHSSEILSIRFTYQACSETFCLFPVTKELSAHVEIIGEKKKLSSLSLGQLVSEEGFATALQENILFAFLLVFLAGILTSFTPCIYPMIPITLSIIGQNTLNRNRRESFLLSLSYVHGIALTYSMLGLFAALSGNLFGQWIGNKVVLGALCALFALMALGMYGFYDIQIPLWMQNKLARRNSKNQIGYLPAFVIGMISGLVASPCVGPVLVSILAFVASTRNAFLGFFLLFTYAMGLGLIFLLLGLFSQMTKLLPRSGPWMNATKFVLGTLMMVGFFYYLNLIVPPPGWYFALGAYLLLTAHFLGAFDRHFKHSHFEKLKRVTAWLCLLAGIGVLANNINFMQMTPTEITTEAEKSRWEPFTEEKLETAKVEAKPVIIDFYADWCLACHELDEKTFSTEVFKQSTQKFHLLRFDATKDSPLLNELKKRYRIQGLPTVVFIDSSGKVLHSITLKSFEKVEDFQKRLIQVH